MKYGGIFGLWAGGGALWHKFILTVYGFNIKYGNIVNCVCGRMGGGKQIDFKLCVA